MSARIRLALSLELEAATLAFSNQRVIRYYSSSWTVSRIWGRESGVLWVRSNRWSDKKVKVGKPARQNGAELAKILALNTDMIVGSHDRRKLVHVHVCVYMYR